MLNDFYRGKRVLITGHTGFKGAWLSLWLNEMGAKVFGYALAPQSETSMYAICGLQDRMESHIGDIRDYSHLERVIEDCQPEIIFHLAAQALVLESYKSPLETYQTNVMGTVNLLEAIRRIKTVRCVVNVTTDKCYENRESFWGYRECDRLGGHDPYSSSKACSELATQAYVNSYFGEDGSTVVATARAGNVIGGGDFSVNRICPDIFRALMNKTELRLRHPEAVRPWQHVLDSLMGYMRLAEKLYREGHGYGGAWNFGPSEENEVNVRSLVGKMRHHWGSTSNITYESESALHETNFLKLDSYKAKIRLNHYSPWDIDRVILETVNWYKTYGYEDVSMYDFSAHQIKSYQEECCLSPDSI